MDLTERVKSFRSRRRQALSWILSSKRQPHVVVAMGNRLSLLLIGQVLARPDSLIAAVTTEEEALKHIQQGQASLLICETALEEGCCIQLCQRARQVTPRIQILALESKTPNSVVWAQLNTLVDVAVANTDLGDHEFPLVRAFIELARERRYRSASLRELDYGPPPSATSKQPERTNSPNWDEPSNAENEEIYPALAPRERQVLQLLSEGRRDREIAATLGITHHTARSYVRDLRRKLGVGSRAAMIALRWRKELGL
jgi:DNA-binding NarL/FixJ family response regulator